MPSEAVAARSGVQRHRAINCRHVNAYAAKAAAPAIMERASCEAKILPSCVTVKARVASATEGAAPKIPANVFGLKTSAREANAQTTKPPMRKRSTNCIATPVAIANRRGRSYRSRQESIARRTWPHLSVECSTGLNDSDCVEEAAIPAERPIWKNGERPFAAGESVRGFPLPRWFRHRCPARPLFL